MNLRTLSVIALSQRAYPSLRDKLSEAVHWMELAAAQGAELVVLPENLNHSRGDGCGVTQTGWVLEDEAVMEPLLEAAQRLRVYVTIPATRRRGWGPEADAVVNAIHLVSPEGDVIWRYEKVSLTPEEILNGVQPGQPERLGPCFDWRGVKVGAMICFDSCFPENLARLERAGADLILFPSLWPGGSGLQAFCRRAQVRIAAAYPAWSRIIDIDGQEVVAGGERQETLRFGFGVPVYTATLNFDRVALYGNGNQAKMAAVLARYGRRVSITFGQDDCLWWLESRCPELQEAEVLREFELVPARAYFESCREMIRCASPGRESDAERALSTLQ